MRKLIRIHNVVTGRMRNTSPNDSVLFHCLLFANLWQHTMLQLSISPENPECLVIPNRIQKLMAHYQESNYILVCRL
jgi:hypothetical protein